MSAPDFEKIYTEYFSDVYKYVLSLCRNEATAEEITQETFFKAMRHIDNFKAIAKQKHIVPEMETVTTAPALDVETDCLDREDAKKIHILLHNLNEPYKEVFMLRVFGELPFSQIGELFGKTDSWARLIFYRAKKQLQEAMK